MPRIPTEEWDDVQVDITPREYVLDYLAHSFPVQLYEPFTDFEGNLSSRPVYRDGQPVESREAVARRDRLIEKLASLPPVPGALDQIVQRFGTDMVAEVTGRSRRVIRKTGARPADGREPRRLGQPRRDRSLHGRRQAHPRLLGRRRHRASATMPSCRRGIAGCASTTCSSPAGRPTPPSRASAAPTAPTRRSRRCSGRSRPT